MHQCGSNSMNKIMPLLKDKIILDLLTILIAGVGLFAILTKFDVPQLRSSFFGENPYR
jgi:hypothetical protein